MRFWNVWARDLEDAKRASALFRWLCGFRVAAYTGAFIVWMSTFLSVAHAVEPDGLAAIRFVWQPKSDSGEAGDAGGAVIQNAFGGEYIYSLLPEASDGRMAQRFYIGRAPRTEYTLFSAEEEAALWSLRDHERHRDDPPARRHVHPLALATRAPAPVIDWPKVVTAPGRVCVPAQGFGDATDWREHLVCWLKEARRVE